MREEGRRAGNGMEREGERKREERRHSERAKREAGKEKGKREEGTSLVVQWLGLCCQWRGRGFNPWLGTRVPDACPKRKRKQKVNEREEEKVKEERGRGRDECWGAVLIEKKKKREPGGHRGSVEGEGKGDWKF